METYPIWRLDEADIESARRLLARAFVDDPQFVYAMPERADRERVFPAFFAVCLRHCITHGDVLATGPSAGEPSGVALVLPSPEGDLTVERAVASGFDPADPDLGPMVARMLAVEESANAILATAYPEPHVHLLQLAVDPAAHGRGLGRTLVKAVVDQASAAKRRSCLFTTAAANVPFYRGCGLAEIGSGVSAVGVPWWAFGTPRPALQ